MNKTELKIFIGMNRAINYINSHTSRIFSLYDLTLSQFAVLEALYHKGSMTIGEVQNKILSSSGTIPLVIKNLEKKGYIEKKQADFDKRKFYLSLTKSGEKIISEVYPKNETKIIELMNVWNEEEKKDLLRLLKKFKNFI